MKLSDVTPALGRSIFSIVALLCVLNLSTYSARACDTCGMHNAIQLPGIMSSLRANGLQENSILVGVQEQLSLYKVRGDNDLRTTESDLELVRTYSATQFTLAYNVSSSFGFQASLPLVTRTYDRFVDLRKVRDEETGIGDGALMATYSPYSWSSGEERIFLAVMGGVKLPTGDSGSLSRVSQQAESQGDNRAQESLQGRGLTLGSGSVDFPIGGVAFLRSERLFLRGSTQYAFRTEGAAGYRFADDLAWSVTPGYMFVLGEDENLSVGVTTSGERKPGDHLDGELLPKTGVDNLYVGPELFYSLDNSLSAQLGADIPVSLDVGGAAVEPLVRFRASLTWVF